jgi:hypothetical protein
MDSEGIWIGNLRKLGYTFPRKTEVNSTAATTITITTSLLLTLFLKARGPLELIEGPHRRYLRPGASQKRGVCGAPPPSGVRMPAG